MEALSLPRVEWAVSCRTKAGHADSGDSYAVQAFPGGVLVGVMDGLGHGDEAAAAARTVRIALERHAQEPIISLLTRCHESLRGTRGATISLASFDVRQDVMTWLGVGNVEGALLRADAQARPRLQRLLLRNGVVGFRLPPLQASLLQVRPGDTLVFVTDGVGSGFAPGIVPSAPPKWIADKILADFGRGTDDALVLVARYRGDRP